ncbi:MAG: MarR family transcriptional regulator [Marinisporobacter sp.]|jgi:DNA-binding MarR family transcriptional regulator|nr:MarR family transcriptional regulator [Marinisporobacter sp.]
MKKELEKGIANLFKLKGECYMHIIHDLELSEMSIKQINYLKKFKASEGITTSQLADILNLSKPTVTEMVKKFIKMDCVYKESCHMDKRVYYLKLTDKGRNIVNIEQKTIAYLAQQLENRLEEEEIETLIDILSKIE